jgi:O-acetylserine/cysteine efflux transporter
MAFIGVAFIVGEPKVSSAWFSVALVVGGAFSWAVGQAMIRALKDIDGLTLTAWIATLAAPQLFIMSFIFEDNQIEAISTAEPVVWAAVFYLGLIMTALGYGIWYSLIRKHPVSLVAPFLLLLPVFSMIGGTVFLGEIITWHTFIGGAIVIGGVAFILAERREPVSIAE